MKFYLEVDFGDRVKGDEAAMVRKLMADALKPLRPREIRIESDGDRRFNDELRSIGFPGRCSGAGREE